MTKSSSKNAKTPLLELRNVIKTYTLGGVKFNALDGVCCKIFDGEFVAITGASGSGKAMVNIRAVIVSDTAQKLPFLCLKFAKSQPLSL